MTQYFDKAHEDLREWWELHQAVAAGGLDEIARTTRLSTIVAKWGVMQLFEIPGAIEHRVIYDCTLAVQLIPELSDELRRAVHDVVIRYAIETMPENAPPADFEEEEEHFRRLNDLIWHLHSCFHEIGTAHPDYGDNPRTPAAAVAARGENEREAMVEAAFAAATPTEHPDVWMSKYGPCTVCPVCKVNRVKIIRSSPVLGMTCLACMTAGLEKP